MPFVVEDIRCNRSKKHKEENQTDQKEVPNVLSLNIQVHEVGRHQQRLDDGNTERSEKHDNFDIGKKPWPQDADCKQDQQPFVNFPVIRVCMFAHYAPVISDSLFGNVKQWEKKNPHRINEVPIDAHILYPLQVFPFFHPKGDNANDDRSAYDVQGV